MNILLDLFLSFAKVGLFTFGGISPILLICISAVAGIAAYGL